MSWVIQSIAKQSATARYNNAVSDAINAKDDVQRHRAEIQAKVARAEKEALKNAEKKSGNKLNYLA